jgi:protein phosphatase
MFCSDGVCGLVDDPEIESALAIPEIEEAVGQLVAVALAEGGIDNITVIVADVVELGGMSDLIVLGAAAERKIPDVATKVREEPGDTEDTIISQRPVLLEENPEGVDEERYTPQAPTRRRLVRPLIGLVVVLLIAAAGLGTAYAWTRTQYFVGAAGDHVAIYQGLSESLPGIGMSRLYEVQQLTLSELPPYYQDKVRANIDVDSLESARETVLELTETARRCANLRPGGEPSSTAKPTATPSPGDKPTTKPSSKPTATPSGTATGSAEPNC